MKIVLPFIAGLLFACFSKLQIHYVFIYVAFAVALVFSFLKNVKGVYTVFLLCCVCFLSGFFSYTISEKQYTNSIVPNSFQYYTARLQNDVKEKKRSYAAVVCVQELKINDSVIPVNEKAQVYFQKTSGSSVLKAGDVIVAKSYFNPVSDSVLGSDYALYLKENKIYFTSYVKGENWSLFRSAEDAFSDIKMFYVNKVRENGFDSLSMQLFSTVFFGDRSVVDDEVRASFSQSGSMHILAVSGLHVGIVAFVFAFVLELLLGKHKFQFYKTCLLIIVVWLYAFLAGMPSSVFRASIMFTMFLISKYVRGEYAPYNSLAVSALIILLVNPQELFSPGFQLSFVAVAGISYLYPVLYKFLATDNIIWNYVWGLTAVSVAAQISTLPIIMFYFKTVPLYGLLANVPAILLATVIISLSMLVVIIPFSPVIVLVSYIYDALSGMLLKILSFISQLPMSTVSFELTLAQLLTVYLVALLIVFSRETFKRNLTVFNRSKNALKI